MRLHERPLGFVINFFLGIAWASVLIGVITSLFAFYHQSWIDAFLTAVLAAIPGLVGVLLLEHIITVKEKYFEMQKQTALLEQILDRLEKKKDIES